MNQWQKDCYEAIMLNQPIPNWAEARIQHKFALKSGQVTGITIKSFLELIDKTPLKDLKNSFVTGLAAEINRTDNTSDENESLSSNG